MKIYRRFVLSGLLILFSFFLSNCDNSEDAVPELLLKTDHYFGDDCENCYVFISDVNGNTLDVQEVDSSVPFMEFYGTTDGPITLTSTSYTNFGTDEEPIDQYGFYTMQNILKGTTLIKEVYEGLMLISLILLVMLHFP